MGKKVATLLKDADLILRILSSFKRPKKQKISEKLSDKWQRVWRIIQVYLRVFLVKEYTFVFSRLFSDSLIKDEKFRVKGNDEYRDFRRLFQNSIDCAKYLCPELEILAKFVIPLTPDKLGGLNLVSKRDENYNEDFEAFKNPAN